MIHEPNPLDPNIIRKIAKRQRYLDSGGRVHCSHDFWDRAKKAEYGDLLLCGRCQRYFAKIKHLPWVCVEKRSTPSTNHLPGAKDSVIAWFTPVEVRVTD